MTPEQEAVLHDIQRQLRGPELSGWPQLGVTVDGRVRGLVDGLAAALTRIGELSEESAALRAQVVELRTEISELEVTTADLAAEVRAVELPWPLSLVQEGVRESRLATGVIALLLPQLARLEALLAPLLPELPESRATVDGKTER